ncbi:Zinc finger, CCHC-type [Trema orientale]|uniref:Zinc finger, CCHC-type n=1 Tax=Trema orientale TaxID=63057 RepID=A0A2P5B098_TREOI|nr:Zinc finger, CCHC-type [Trema orientale]
MSEGTAILDHLSVLNVIVSELEAIRVKTDDEDKALRLIWSLPSSYEHMKPILMYKKETVIFSEVTSKLFSKERRLSNGGNSASSECSALMVDTKRRNFMKKNIIYWTCRQAGHVKRNCPKGGASSAGCSKSDKAANIAFCNGGIEDTLE